jgi:hypothetical protein
MRNFSDPIPTPNPEPEPDTSDWYWYGTPEEWISDELGILWEELWEAEEKGNRPDWQIVVLEGRIQNATSIVGPVSWRDVPGRYVLSGGFSKACERMGIVTDEPSREDLEDLMLGEVFAEADYLRIFGGESVSKFSDPP